MTFVIFETLPLNFGSSKLFESITNTKDALLRGGGTTPWAFPFQFLNN